PGCIGVGRRLDPTKFYLACLFQEEDGIRDLLRNSLAAVVNPQNGRSVSARPVDWGPNPDTNRVADLSPGVAAALGLNTDDFVSVTIFRSVPPFVTGDNGHGSANPRAKPAIKQFIESPNQSSRNGAKLNIVLLTSTAPSLS